MISPFWLFLLIGVSLVSLEFSDYSPAIRAHSQMAKQTIGNSWQQRCVAARKSYRGYFAVTGRHCFLVSDVQGIRLIVEVAA